MADLEQLLAMHGRAHDAFATLLRTGRGDDPIPHLEWTVGDLGAHILAGLRAYRTAAADGGQIWETLDNGPAENARLLAITPERDAATIAVAIPPATRTLHDAWRSHPGETILWSGGLTLRLTEVVGLHLGDVLVHGWDLSKAVRRPWEIPRAEAAESVRAALAVGPHFLAPAAASFSGTYGVKLRGGGGQFTLAFDNGTLTVIEGADGKVDCRLNADPRAFLLSAYGRIPVWRTAVTGGIVATGRKPWLAFKFKSLVRSP
jgi:hypothetical protein